MGESVTVPKPLLKELQRHLEGIEEIMNKEGLERIQEAVKEYEKGEYTVAGTPEDIEKSLTKD